MYKILILKQTHINHNKSHNFQIELDNSRNCTKNIYMLIINI